MNNLVSKIRINPVLNKELKVKMRGWKAPILIGIYNLVLALLTLLFLKVTILNSGMGMDPRMLFTTYIFMAIVQFGLITLIAPALTAGAISGEREKQTLDILLSTTLNHRAIIMGKLFASLSHVILLVLSSIPTFSIIFLWGGIGVKELIQTFLFYVVLAITLGSVGMFFSTFLKKSTAANVLSYAVVIFLYLGTLIITTFYVSLVLMPKATATYNPYSQTQWLMYLNPAAGFGAMLANQFGVTQGMSLFPGFYLGGNSGSYLWYINVIVDLSLSLILLILCSIKLNPIKNGLLKGLIKGKKSKTLKDAMK